MPWCDGSCLPPDDDEDEDQHTLQIVRTIPEKVYEFAPHGDFRILEAYTRALREARSLIYIESQFLWSPEISDILAAKLRDPPTDDFRMIVVLPTHPNNGQDCTRGQLGVLAAADDGARRFLAATVISRTGQLGGPLYVHAKVGIVDDRWMTIGSANLNDHSLFNDSEVNVITDDPQLVRRPACACGPSTSSSRSRLWTAHGARRRRALAADRRRAARAPPRRRGAHAPAARAARRVAARDGRCWVPSTACSSTDERFASGASRAIGRACCNRFPLSLITGNVARTAPFGAGRCCDLWNQQRPKGGLW